MVAFKGSYKLTSHYLILEAIARPEALTVSEVAGAVSWVLCLLRFTPRAASTASSSIWPSPRFDISRFRERTVGIAIQGSALTCAVRRAEMLLRCT
eukprot:6184620-Pleurochrysis_carterae.AAC.2